MITLLFLSNNGAIRGAMAAGFARVLAPAEVRVFSASTNPAACVHPLAVKVLREVEIAIADHQPLPVESLDLHDVDVVVVLSQRAAGCCPVEIPGSPACINWDVGGNLDQKFSDEQAALTAFREMRETIRQYVDELFLRKYLQALADARLRANLILDSLSEGIIAHDKNRRITYYNQAAETITGYSRDEVVGRDCHQAFPAVFCGQRCRHCELAEVNESVAKGDREATATLKVQSFAMTTVTKSGEQRNLETTICPITDRSGAAMGVVVSFRDLTREHTLARRLGEIEQFAGIIGRDRQMLEVFDLIRSLADSTASVLVTGESGTGKELVAAAIHNESARAGKPFVAVNCGALPETLLESELFGHVRGAFTGAIRDKKGRFELADGGTIFLDEIGDISTLMQVKLLRVLQNGTFEPVGADRTLTVDVRVIAATNKDLASEIKAKRFREDLFYRLCVVPVQLPPLRKREADIPLLATHFLKQACLREGRETAYLSPGAMDALIRHTWPGNIRELQNALQFALVKCREPLIEQSHLPPALAAGPLVSLVVSPAAGTRRTQRRKLGSTAVRAALEATGGNKVEAARQLGVARATLYRFLNEHLGFVE